MMDLDVILKELGQFGRYQIYTFILLLFAIIITTFYSMSFVFTAGDLDYRCYVPECETQNSTDYDPKWIPNALPSAVLGMKCYRYKPINNITSGKCWNERFRNETERCNEFVYKSEETTIVNEFQLLCEENKWKLGAVGTINSVGQFIGLPLAGAFSDKFGRKALLLTAIMLSTIMGIARSLSPNYLTFLFFEMMDAIVASGTYSACFILGIEIVGPDKRVLGSTLISCCYSIGEVIMGGVAWLFPNWRTYLRVLYTPGLLFVFYIWLLPESIRWLIANKKYKEVKRIIKRIATVNKKVLSESIEQKLEQIQSGFHEEKNREEKDNVENKITQHNAIEELFTSKIMLLRVVNCSFCWITNTFVFYGLALNSVSVGGNKYTNFMLVALAEIPGYIITWIVLDKVGRRLGLFGSLFLSGLACIAFYFVHSDMLTIRLLLFLFGKCFITASFTVLYIFTSEMFPTPLRHSLLGACSMFGRIGSMIAPLMIVMAAYVEPVLIFGGVAVIAGMLALLFPETQDTELPDTMSEAENIGKKAKTKT